MKCLNSTQHAGKRGTIIAYGGLIFVFGAIFPLVGQDAPHQAGDQQRQLSPVQIVGLLRKPNGLQAAAAIVGHFVINPEPEVWGRPDLATLVQQSAVIAKGKIAKRESKLEEDGNIIVTYYVLRPSEMLKGRSSGDLSDVTFGTRGGLIEFPNGTSAEERTIAWERLQIGKEYAVLLSSDPREGYIPTNGIEGLFGISGSDGIVDSFAAHHDEHHRTTKEVEGLKSKAFLDKLRAKIASK